MDGGRQSRTPDDGVETPHNGFGRDRKDDTVSAEVLMSLIEVPDIRSIRQLDVLIEHLEGLQTRQLSDQPDNNNNNNIPSRIPLKVWHVIFTLCIRSTTSTADCDIVEALGIDLNATSNLTVASSLSQAYNRQYKQSLKPSIQDRSKLLLSSWLNVSTERKIPSEFISLECLVASFLVSDRVRVGVPLPVKRLLRDGPRKNYDIMSQLNFLSSSQTESLPPSSPERFKSGNVKVTEIRTAEKEKETQTEKEQHEEKEKEKETQKEKNEDNDKENDIISDSEAEYYAVIVPEIEVRKFRYGNLLTDSKRESPSLDDSFGILDTMPHLVALGLRSPVSRSRSPLKRLKIVVKDEDVLIFGHQSLSNRLNPDKGGYNLWKLIKYWLLNSKPITENNLLYGDILHWIFEVLERNYIWELNHRIGSKTLNDSKGIIQAVLEMDRNGIYFLAKHINTLATTKNGILLNNLIEQIGGSKFNRLERIIDTIFGDLTDESPNSWLVLDSCYEYDNVGIQRKEKEDGQLETFKKFELRLRVLFLVFCRISFNNIKSFIDSNPIGSYATTDRMMELIAGFLSRMKVDDFRMFFNTAVYWNQNITYLQNLEAFGSSLYRQFISELAMGQFVNTCGIEYVSTVPLLKQRYSKEALDIYGEEEDRGFTNLISSRGVGLDFWLDRVKEKETICKCIVDADDDDGSDDRIMKMNWLLDWLVELHQGDKEKDSI